MSPLDAWEPSASEARRQEVWRARDAFLTPTPDGPGVYIKASAPFTSGNVHIGHVRSYAIGDAYARFSRARGENVLFAFGFDAFGLPAELGAIAGGVPPSEWVAQCAHHMTGQLGRLGFSFDWTRTFTSSDALMYRWSQWLFVTLLERGLIYRGTGTVDWCDTCQTTLASIQVEEGGTCWRCHNPVRLIQRPEWYLRVSAYLEENDRRLADLRNWDETSLASQHFVLGRVDGVELELTGGGESLTVFTPHADALAQARFVLLSPKHPDVEAWASDPSVAEQLEELRSGGWERSSRDVRNTPLIDTHRTVAPPGAGRDGGTGELPVLVSPLVDGRFGATAVLGVPARDPTDAGIAQRLWGEDWESTAAPTLHDPPPAQPTKRYKAGDFAISRQRSWGTPIPIVYCPDHGAVPVPVEQQPVLLPLDVVPTGEGNPLAERPDFVDTTCPTCGGPARRETDTLDCHFDALWLWIPACVPPRERAGTLEQMLALPDLRAWLPSERLVAGTDSGNFVFDQRIVTKALRDIGPLAFLADGEPFAGCLFHEMVIRDGRKMSKHLGNVVDPDELLERFGADTLRLAVLYAARPQKSLNWSDSAVAHCHRFLKGLWAYTRAQVDSDPGLLDAQGVYVTEHLRVRLQKWCQTAVEKVTEDMQELEMHTAVRNVMRLLDRIKDFEKKALARSGGVALGRENHEALLGALAILAQMLIPFAPHAGEELLLACTGGEHGDYIEPTWPALADGEAGPGGEAGAGGAARTETVTSAGGAGI